MLACGLRSFSNVSAPLSHCSGTTMQFLLSRGTSVIYLRRYRGSHLSQTVCSSLFAQCPCRRCARRNGNFASLTICSGCGVRGISSVTYTTSSGVDITCAVIAPQKCILVIGGRFRDGTFSPRGGGSFGTVVLNSVRQSRTGSRAGCVLGGFVLTTISHAPRVQTITRCVSVCGSVPIVIYNSFGRVPVSCGHRLFNHLASAFATTNYNFK